MKLIVLVCLVIVVVYAKDEPPYTTKYDDIDVDEILANKRLTLYYADCLLGKGKCNDQGQTLKDIVPDALNNECKRCSEKQKEATEKVLRYLAKHYRDIWNSLIAHFDKDGKHRDQYKKYIDEMEAA
ncbi:hypothetical protein PPYR_10100 [Photinus pyralis]|uniref:Uncharacterized protein n=2 Tax=Photinus pyralis TaxID=7054 RepID=A0A5N4AFG0_PHOPY|nr:ejaculatory bulb-specific protein 3-like [Photinus pyralis]KAB0796039.1 hypothetical protein PPYR_10100 [Photinus pyralis]